MYLHLGGEEILERKHCVPLYKKKLLRFRGKRAMEEKKGVLFFEGGNKIKERMLTFSRG